MNPPTHIKRNHLRGGNAFIAIWDAQDQLGQKLLLLEAAADAAPHLAQAQAALAALHAESARLTACPFVIDWQQDDSGAMLVLGGIHGAPLRAQWPSPVAETEVLQLAGQQANLLAALHDAGFSGLRPALDDVWQDADSGLFTLLGWEGVQASLGGRSEDWQAAACGWASHCPSATWSWRIRTNVYPPMLTYSNDNTAPMAMSRFVFSHGSWTYAVPQAGQASAVVTV